MNSFVTVLDQDHNLNEEWTYSDLVNVAIIMQYETNLNTNTMNETKMIVKRQKWSSTYLSPVSLPGKFLIVA